MHHLSGFRGEIRRAWSIKLSHCSGVSLRALRRNSGTFSAVTESWLAISETTMSGRLHPARSSASGIPYVLLMRIKSASDGVRRPFSMSVRCAGAMANSPAISRSPLFRTLIRRSRRMSPIGLRVVRFVGLRATLTLQTNSIVRLHANTDEAISQGAKFLTFESSLFPHS